MSRINTNVTSLVAYTNLTKNQASLSTSITRLSSGLRINSGADDPSGLIISQKLKSEMGGISAAIDNSTQAQNVISTADAAMQEVSNLLVSIKGLVVQAANSGAMSSDEIQANQLQIDSAIESVTRIANSTTFGGMNLLDGSLGYVTSGVQTSAIHDVNVTNATVGPQSTIPVTVNVIQSATQAALTFASSSITTSVTLEIKGNTGVQDMSFVSGTAASAMAYAINQVSDSTGVQAIGSSTGITFKSTAYGSSQYVSVTAIGSSNFQTLNSSGGVQTRTTGNDAVATINGVKATANGLTLSLNTQRLSMSMNLDSNFGTGTENFSVVSGGVTFQLGASVQSNQQVSIGINSVAASSLGNAADGYLSDLVTGGSASLVGGNEAKASKILDDAINQVSESRGRLGAFEANTLDTNINSLQVALENVTSSNSSIEDVDFAQETANLTSKQVLVQAGTSVLSQANSMPQTVLSLLQGH